MKRLSDNGLTAKPAKCQFGIQKCVYLGHVVGNGQVCPQESKLKAVEAFSLPSTKRQVHAFLGLTGYYRRFIPDYATLAAPLTDLTRKSASDKVEWTAQCDWAFQELTRHLCTAPVLQSPNFSLPFVLQTDVSDLGVGAVLAQRDENNCDHPVAYFNPQVATS